MHTPAYAVIIARICLCVTYLSPGWSDKESEQHTLAIIIFWIGLVLVQNGGEGGRGEGV